MDTLRAIQWFVRVADVGSFTQVAEQANASKSMVSKEIRRLEDALGARLLHRSTRSVQLTHAGEGYLPRARKIIEQIEDAESFVQDLQQRPRGKLKISVPMALGITDLPALFADFLAAYPEIELDMHLSDEPVDLVAQGFDVGFRATSRPFDSQYVGRPLTQFTYRICVAADYFDHHPAIDIAQDLAQHNCFIYSNFQGKNLWPLEGEVAVKGTLRVNSTLFMMEAIKQGQGIGFIPEFACREALANGEVVEILATTKKPSLTLYGLYPARTWVPPKVIQCIEFVEQWFAERRQ